MVLKEQLVLPEIFENTYFKQQLFQAFPQVLQERYAAEMETHPLKAEIIATKLANMLVNDMGANFAQRMMEETGANIAEVAISFAIARDLFDLPKVWSELESLDNVIAADLQTRLLFQLRRTMRRVTRWFLRHRNKALDIVQTVAFFKPAFTQISGNLSQFLAAAEAESLLNYQQKLVGQQVPVELARYLSQLSTVFSVMDIAQIADQEKTELAVAAEIYFKLGDRLDLHWFLEQITQQPVTNHWQALARASYREELDWQQRALAQVVIRTAKNNEAGAEEVVARWLAANDSVLARWRHMLAEFKTTKSHEFAKFSVALRELMLLSHHCDTV
jgi:glutamate dehydrogenase